MQSLLDVFPPYWRKFSRELENSLNQFERLQGIRKGRPLPPLLDVNIS
jgi:hypothetical protein